MVRQKRARSRWVLRLHLMLVRAGTSVEDWKSKCPELAKWKVDVRYDASGSHVEKKVEALMKEAKPVVEKIVLALWMDGVVPENFAW